MYKSSNRNGQARGRFRSIHSFTFFDLFGIILLAIVNKFVIKIVHRKGSRIQIDSLIIRE